MEEDDVTRGSATQQSNSQEDEGHRLLFSKEERQVYGWVLDYALHHGFEELVQVLVDNKVNDTPLNQSKDEEAATRTRNQRLSINALRGVVACTPDASEPHKWRHLVYLFSTIAPEAKDRNEQYQHLLAEYTVHALSAPLRNTKNPDLAVFDANIAKMLPDIGRELAKTSSSRKNPKQKEREKEKEREEDEEEGEGEEGTRELNDAEKEGAQLEYPQKMIPRQAGLGDERHMALREELVKLSRDLRATKSSELQKVVNRWLGKHKLKDFRAALAEYLEPLAASFGEPFLDIILRETGLPSEEIHAASLLRAYRGPRADFDSIVQQTHPDVINFMRGVKRTRQEINVDADDNSNRSKTAPASKKANSTKAASATQKKTDADKRPQKKPRSEVSTDLVHATTKLAKHTDVLDPRPTPSLPTSNTTVIEEPMDTNDLGTQQPSDDDVLASPKPQKKKPAKVASKPSNAKKSDSRTEAIDIDEISDESEQEMQQKPKKKKISDKTSATREKETEKTRSKEREREKEKDDDEISEREEEEQEQEHDQDGRRKRVPWTIEEEEHLRAGVEEYGVGKWAEILTNFKFQWSRTNVSLKDKWRNMQLLDQRQRQQAASARKRAQQAAIKKEQAEKERIEQEEREREQEREEQAEDGQPQEEEGEGRAADNEEQEQEQEATTATTATKTTTKKTAPKKAATTTTTSASATTKPRNLSVMADSD